MKRKWKQWAICAAILAGSSAGAGLPAAGSRRSWNCACSGAPVSRAGPFDRSSVWKQWAICAAILAGSLAGGRLLRHIRSFQRLNLRALDARFVAPGRLPASYTPESCMFWRPSCAQATRASDEPIPSAGLRSFASEGHHES
jgi:hypothetical protein